MLQQVAIHDGDIIEVSVPETESRIIYTKLTIPKKFAVFSFENNAIFSESIFKTVPPIFS